ncbi:MAG TPA: response regulator [Bacteroidales bacterium]|nr:response regulator [Bacteroidales bacterium]
MDKNKLIFIVDDDPFVTSLVVKRFVPEGFRVESFSYGEVCLQAMDKKPDLIILDYYFTKPGQDVMNGMEVFDKIKEKDPEVLVVMLSGQERGEIVLELARKGIDDYVIKDNNLIDNLNASVKELLGRKYS